MPCSLAWQDRAWGGTQEGLCPAQQRWDCSASHFLLPTQSASYVTAGFSATNFTPIHAIHILFHAIKHHFCGLLPQLYICSGSTGWEEKNKKRKHLCINTNVLGLQGHQMGDQDQALCSMDIASLCPWQFLALFTQ